MELIVTLTVLVLIVAGMFICYVQQKKPVNPAKPRIIPYGTIMLFLSLALVVTTAHVISVVTGEQVMPKNKAKGQGR